MNNIFELIKRDWKGDEPIRIACARICDYLFTQKKHPDFYTFKDFKELVDQEDTDVAEAVMYLSTPRLKVLKLNLMYEHRDYILDLPQEEVVNYSNNDPVIHPTTGEVMQEDEILVCFLPGLALNNG